MIPRRIRSFVACALGVAVLAPAEAVQAARAPGMDISEYQTDHIDWDKVKDDGIRFVIHRATRGNDYVDATYDIDRPQANGHHIKWAAYHYAKPSGRDNDAVEEADFFLQHADVSSGDMIPALDAEDHGHLNAARMQDWIARWLNRVRHKTGVKPMIYTSPSFWRTYLADTQRFAKRGYRLWIAHWHTKKPDVPAHNWARKSWTFWQYTSDGSVKGIPGRVDLDKLNSTRFKPLLIP